MAFAKEQCNVKVYFNSFKYSVAFPIDTSYLTYNANQVNNGVKWVNKQISPVVLSLVFVWNWGQQCCQLRVIHLLHLQA